MNSTDEIGRHAFDEWCWRRGLELRDVVDRLRDAALMIRRETGRELRVPSLETVRLIRLPFSDPRRRVPGQDVMELIVRATGGAIRPGDFYADAVADAAIPERAAS